MKWGKLVLLFQAIVTLIIGITLLSQVTSIGTSSLSDVAAKMSSTEGPKENISSTIEDVKIRFTVAAYFLLAISLIEIILISTLIS